MASACESSLARHWFGQRIGRFIDRLLCRVGLHNARYKYDMTDIAWPPLGWHCCHCDCKLDYKTINKPIPGYGRRLK